MDPGRRYFFPIVGYNYRMTNVAAALLCAQLERRDVMLAARRSLYEDYREGLAGNPGIQFQPVASWAEICPWSFPVVLNQDCPVSRDELMAGLDELGIETRPFFIPVHELPPYREEWARQKVDGELLPVTSRLASAGLLLPTASTYGKRVAVRVCEAVAAITTGRR